MSFVLYKIGNLRWELAIYFFTTCSSQSWYLDNSRVQCTCPVVFTFDQAA
jgi:hypothetical protein